MSRPQVMKEEPLNMVEVKHALSKVKRRDKELSYRANKTQEYLDQFVTLSKKEADQLYEELTNLGVPRLKDMHIKKLMDLMPANQEDVRLVLSGFSTLTVSQENMKKIAKVIKEYIREE